MRLILVMILLAAVSLSGCNGTNTNVNTNTNSNANKVVVITAPPPIRPEAPPDPAFKPCNPYFPLVPGSVAKYVINYSSGIVGDLVVVVDAADEDGRKVFTQRSQLVDRSGGMQIVQTIVRRFVCDGERVQILSEKTDSNIAGQQSSTEFEYRDNSLIMIDPKSMTIKGSTWTHAFRIVYHNPGQPPSRSDVPTIIGFEVQGPQDVTTAVGTFKAVSVLRKVADNLVVDYFAPGLGLVKRQAKEGTSWEIKEYSGLKSQDL
jgi:hypothetical protein